MLLDILFPEITLVLAAIGALISMILLFTNFEKTLNRDDHDETGHAH